MSTRITSPIVPISIATVPVTYTITLSVSPTSGYIGDVFTFSGRVTASGTGFGNIRVNLMLGTSTIANAWTDASGYYSFTWNANIQGTLSFYTEAYV